MKKWKSALFTGILILACTGCGEQKQSSVNVLESSNDIVQEAEDSIVESSAPVNEVAQEEAEERNDAAADLESKAVQGVTAAFAEQIKTAMADKDMEALADLCSYPLAVEGEVVESRDAFMELDEGVIFTDERCAAIEAVDTSVLEVTMAGIVMGDGVPNIIFKSVDGVPGITGIN